MKKITVLLLIVMLAFNCVACTPHQNSREDYKVDLNVPYDIEAELVVGITADPMESDMIDALAAAFNEIYENVTITKKIIQGQSYTQALMGLYGSKGMPDILFSSSSENSMFIDKGILLNLDRCIEAEVAANSEWLGQFYENMWNLGKEKYRGSQYLIPRSNDRVVAHYNKEIFRQAKVDMSLVHNGWTWEEFIEVMTTVRNFFDANGRNNDYLLDSYMNWEAVMSSVFASFDAKIFEDKTLAVDNQNTRDALALMRQLVDLKIIAPMNSQASANFEGGQGAMLFHSAPASKYQKLLKDDYDLVTFPLIGREKAGQSEKDYSNAKIGAGVPGYAIFNETENVSLAWKFLSFMLTPEGQNALAVGGSTCLPIRKDMSDPRKNTWGSDLGDINISAYYWEIERNTATDFYLDWDSRYHADLLSALSDMVYSHLSTPGLSASNSIAKFTEDCEDILGL